MAVPVKHSALGLHPGPPPRCHHLQDPAPDVGEHTDEVLGELGFSADDIARLRRDKVV